jgi:hypothetical protein
LVVVPAAAVAAVDDAPEGRAAMVRKGADAGRFRENLQGLLAARAAGIPFTLGMLSVCPLETVSAAAGLGMRVILAPFDATGCCDATPAWVASGQYNTTGWIASPGPATHPVVLYCPEGTQEGSGAQQPVPSKSARITRMLKEVAVVSVWSSAAKKGEAPASEASEG